MPNAIGATRVAVEALPETTAQHFGNAKASDHDPTRNAVLKRLDALMPVIGSEAGNQRARWLALLTDHRRYLCPEGPADRGEWA